MTPYPAQFLVHVGRAEGNTLVNLHVLPDHARLAYHHPRAVVYVEMRAYPGAGMDVYPGEAVGVFGDHSRQDRDAEAVYFMGDAVYHHGVKTGIAQHDFRQATRRRIALPVHFGIFHQRGVNGRQGGEKLLGQMPAITSLAVAQRADNGLEFPVERFPTRLQIGQRKLRSLRMGKRSSVRLSTKRYTTVCEGTRWEKRLWTR